MRRMPDERRLSTLVRGRATTSTEHLRDIARVVAAFHAARRHVARDRRGRPRRRASRRRWEANFAQMRPLRGPVLDAGDVDARRATGRAATSPAASRCSPTGSPTGGSVDGHGDLLADDIFCLDDGPRILDCIEFDDRLRYGDVPRRRRLPRHGPRAARAPADLGERFLAVYGEFAGETYPASLGAPLHRLPRPRPGEGRLPARRPGRARSAATQAARLLLAWRCEHLEPAGSGSSSSAGCPAPASPRSPPALADATRLDRAALRRGAQGARRARPRATRPGCVRAGSLRPQRATAAHLRRAARPGRDSSRSGRRWSSTPRGAQETGVRRHAPSGVKPAAISSSCVAMHPPEWRGNDAARPDQASTRPTPRVKSPPAWRRLRSRGRRQRPSTRHRDVRMR